MAEQDPHKPAEPKATGPYRITDFSPRAIEAIEQQRDRRLLWTGRFVVILLTVTFVGLLGRVYQLQAKPNPQIVALQDSQIGTAELAAMRGGMVDRTGRVIASTRVGYRLFCDPAYIADRADFVSAVWLLLRYDPSMLAERLSVMSRQRYIVLDERMSDEQVTAFNKATEQGTLPKGLYVERITVRDYPQGPLAGTLVGFVGRDGDGLEGLERHWEDRLHAKPGQYQFMRDFKRRRMWVNGEGYVPFEDGQNIRLSIDANIQRIAEEELAATVKQYSADSGQIIVMQPNTGEILAIATFPTYSPSAFQDVNDEQRRNRPVTDMFEPGSIFKPFVWAALTEKGVVKPSDKVDTTTSGAWPMPNGRVLHDVHGKGLISWHEVLKYSSNIGMAKAAQKVSVEELFGMMQSFGFGRKTGIDLPGEVGGMLVMHDNTGARSYSHGSWPMGQEIGVTGIQIVRAMCVLANGGVMVEPRIEAYRPREDDQPLVPPQRVVSQRTAEATLYAMRESVLDGTGKKANSPYYDNFGKTGTAQLPDPATGRYFSDRYMSSFLGGSPVEKPRIVVGVFIRDPKRSIGHYGGIVAAPAFRNVVDRTLLYLGVPPNEGANAVDLAVEQFDVIE